MRAGRICVALALLAHAQTAVALDESKEDAGADHEDAHRISTGVLPFFQDGVDVGVIEACATLATGRGLDDSKDHLGSRLQSDFDFFGETPPLTADPADATGNSDHATLVSDVVASEDSTYLGVAKQADVYLGCSQGHDSHRAAADWVSRVYAPILNNSWASIANDGGANQRALFWDWMVEHRDVVIVSAAGNEGNGGRMVLVPSDAFNNITVGAVDGNLVRRADYSSYWLAGDDGTAEDVRGKPEIVAPGGDSIEQINSGTIGSQGTSFASPHVTGVSTLLVGNGLYLPGIWGTTHLAHKAIILNSARKRAIKPPMSGQRDARDNASTGSEESDYDYLLDGKLREGASGGTGPYTDEWTPTNWSYSASTFFSTVHPLDDELGTGLLDAERALIQSGGSKGLAKYASTTQTGQPVPRIGWDVSWVGSGNVSQEYQVAGDFPGNTFFTVTLTWDREITTPDNDQTVDTADIYTASPLANLDLEIREIATNKLVASSRSIGENTEHLHVPVTAGKYKVVVLNNDPAGTYYGLAWWAYGFRIRWDPTCTPLNPGCTLSGGSLALSTTGLVASAYVAPSLGAASPTVGSVAISGSLGTGNLGPIQTAAPLSQNTLPVHGSLRVCLLDPSCMAPISFPLTLNGSVGFGIGGSFASSQSSVAATISGAPWTLGTQTIFVPTTNGGTQSIVASGFIHGAASLTSTLEQSGGILRLVSPIRISTNLPEAPHLEFMGEINLRFIPEPRFLLLFSTSAAALAILGWRRTRNRSSQPTGDRR